MGTWLVAAGRGSPALRYLLCLDKPETGVFLEAEETAIAHKSSWAQGSVTKRSWKYPHETTFQWNWWFVGPNCLIQNTSVQGAVVDSEVAFLHCSPWAPGQANPSLGQTVPFFRLGPGEWCWNRQTVKHSMLILRQWCDGTQGTSVVNVNMQLVTHFFWESSLNAVSWDEGLGKSWHYSGWLLFLVWCFPVMAAVCLMTFCIS